MSDIEKLTTLLDEFGVTYTRNDAPESSKFEMEVRIETDGPKNEGYSGFLCAWMFSRNGTFLRVGVWE